MARPSTFIRIWKTTRKKLKKLATDEEKSMVKLVDELIEERSEAMKSKTLTQTKI